MKISTARYPQLQLRHNKLNNSCIALFFIRNKLTALYHIYVNHTKFGCIQFSGSEYIKGVTTGQMDNLIPTML